MSMKNSNATIGNRTRDLPACSAVPQPTAPPRALQFRWGTLPNFVPELWNLKIKIYRTIILPVVLYGCETWSLTLREERRLRVFENRVLRRIFGPKRGEVTGEWRKLRNGKLNNLYSSPNIVRVIKSRRMRWAGHVARMGEG